MGRVITLDLSSFSRLLLLFTVFYGSIPITGIYFYSMTYSLNSLRYFYAQESGISLWMFHVNLRRICILLLLDEVVYQIRSDQSLSRDRLFATPRIAARQASLSITNTRGSLRLMSIESVMPSIHLILCHPLLLLPPIPPSIRVFSNESTLRMRWLSTGVSALVSFLPKKSQGWSPLEWTGWISLQSKGLSRVFSNTTVQKNQFFGAQLSSRFNSHIHTWPQEKP